MQLLIRRFWPVPAGVALLLSGCGNGGAMQAGPATPPAEGYLLRIQGDAGDKYSYDASFDTDMGGQIVFMTMSWEVEITEADADQLTYLMRVGETKMRVGEEEVPVPQAPQDTTLVVDRMGRFLSDPSNGDSQPMSMATMGGTFPEHRVKVGDSWTGDVPMEGETVTFRYTLVGVENYKKVNAVVLEMALDGEAAGLSLPEPMKMLVHPTTGQLLLSEGVMVMHHEGVSFPTKVRVELVDRSK